MSEEAIEKNNVDETVEEIKEETIEEEEVERPYTMRKFRDSDLFPLLQILKKIGIKDCKDAFIQVASGEKTLKQIGILASFDIIDILIGNIGKAENEMYSLYSDMSGIPVDEMKQMEFGTLPLMIMDSFNEVKNTAFFKVLSRLL